MEILRENTTDEDVLMLTNHRKQFKQALFRDVFYGDNRAHYSRHSGVASTFRKEFPSVWKFIQEQKIGDGDRSFARLAQNMQQRESQYMIGTVCVRLARFHPEIPLLTIHDSILTTNTNAPTVERIMQEEFARLGVRPQIRIEQAIRHAEGAGEQVTMLNAA
jgi:hypothetical protein